MATYMQISKQAVSKAVNKQVQSKILDKRMNVCIEHIKHSKSQDSVLKCVKKLIRKKRKPNKGTWVQVKHQPAPPRAVYFVRAHGKELETIPYESMK
ncbi:60S ribosomal protein L21 [Galemys pyrenaicus]|uniref:60S ribosomal protein L21 n=1 Tax=Galemys pyrenaicus TaxID=202257 RepID=A0A8J6DPC7_GALPY|nr:60S ribosomal protein L21 [Galemys pyrenaicus]